MYFDDVDSELYPLATSPIAGPRLFKQDATDENDVAISLPNTRRRKDKNIYESM